MVQKLTSMKMFKTHGFLHIFEDGQWSITCFVVIVSGRRASHCYQRHHVKYKHEYENDRLDVSQFLRTHEA